MQVILSYAQFLSIATLIKDLKLYHSSNQKSIWQSAIFGARASRTGKSQVLPNPVVFSPHLRVGEMWGEPVVS